MTRPLFTLVLRPEPGIDPVLALRAALKVLLRNYGLRCVRLATSDPLELELALEQHVADVATHTRKSGNDA